MQNHNFRHQSHERGIVTAIILIIIAIILLKFVFDVDVINALYYVKDVILIVWNDFLYEPVMFLWGLISHLFTK